MTAKRPSAMPTTVTAGATDSASRVVMVIGMVCLAAIQVRWFIPTENTADGANLWLAAFWGIAAAVASFFPIAKDVISQRWTRADAVVALLIGGHVLSGMLVLIQGGQRQLAANLIAEWLGLLALWSIARQLVRVPMFRMALWWSTLLCVAVIAVYGCWQHWVSLPGMAQRLGPKFDAVRAARAVGGMDPAEQELSREGVPLTEPEFTLFEKRLRDSREPFGFFALANTLGGILAAGLMLLLSSPRCEKSPARFPYETVLMAMAIGVCLLLTKSRTAWVAVMLVGGIAINLRFLGGRFRASLSRRTTGIVAACLIGAVLIGTLLLRYGSWDRETLAEAPKSLLYRWQYWTGTARLIAEHPVLGGGLGQFRNDYLRVKEPAASEEIADPHNWLLDVWYNGGLLAFVGGLWFIGTLVVTTWKTRADTVDAMESPPASWLFAGAVSPWVAFLFLFLTEGSWDDQLLIVGFALVAGAIGIHTGRIALPPPSRTACGLAALVLCTHLLGAGGIGYTAVMQLLLLLLAGIFSTIQKDEPEKATHPWLWIYRSGSIALAVTILLLWNPRGRQILNQADNAVAHGASPQSVRVHYARAKRENPWDPTPYARLAELEFRELQNATSPDAADILKATRELQIAIQHDPANGHWWRRLGEMLETWHERHPSAEFARESMQAFLEAIARYPTNARWQADLSDAAAMAGDEALAAKAAAAAIAQDDLNQRMGHVERILTGDVRNRLISRTKSAVSD